jgi:quercetin dioxygenase-like cupin family protein
MKTGPVEAGVRLPANYTFPTHSHTSDETYIWIKGDFTYVAEDGTAMDLSGQTFISLPGNVPHALVCKEQPCLFYLRYSRAFNMRIYPMPKLKKVSLKTEEKK